MFGHQPLVLYWCVCEYIYICVSADMLPYSSAHDGWLLMKLLQVCHIQYCQQCVNFFVCPVQYCQQCVKFWW